MVVDFLGICIRFLPEDTGTGRVRRQTAELSRMFGRVGSEKPSTDLRGAHRQGGHRESIYSLPYRVTVSNVCPFELAVPSGSACRRPSLVLPRR
jgi:hypothetical protein